MPCYGHGQDYARWLCLTRLKNYLKAVLPLCKYPIAAEAALGCPEQCGTVIGCISGIWMEKTSFWGACVQGIGHYEGVGDEASCETTAYSLRKLVRELEMCSCPRSCLLQIYGGERMLLLGCRKFDAFLTQKCPAVQHELWMGSRIYDFVFWGRMLLEALQFCKMTRLC